ncbi:MAG: UvrB/UvrC motif-containing protein [Parachlamydiaceae bacterium]|nr:UvrB/UvrC motif-containing protein [Parachlamydiaceae bacterium]
MAKIPENPDNTLPEDDSTPHEAKIPDRPLECTDCKKPVAVNYTEIVGPVSIHTCMCTDCPVLKRKLYGLPSSSSGDLLIEGRTGLACGNCGTTLDSVHVGSPLGCNVCYEIFDEMLIPELASMGKIPLRLVSGKRTQTIHIGRGPGQMQEISSSMRLLALNEALTETLQREDYEQAALLRDQIKALTDKQQEKNNDGRSP